MPPSRKPRNQFGADEIFRLASLAYIEIAPSEVEQMSRQLGDIVEYFRTLRKVDTGDLAPRFDSYDITNRFRNDEARVFPADDVLRSVPQKKGRFVKAPRAI